MVLNVIVTGVVIAFVYWMFNLRQKNYEYFKQEYFGALDYFSKNPTDPNAKEQCFVKGRNFYAYDIPDTDLFDERSNILMQKNNYTDREAKIQADIDERIKLEQKIAA